MPSVDRGHTDAQRILCIVDPTLTGEGGHSLAYNLLLAEAATALANKPFEFVEIFADKAFRAKHGSSHPVYASLNLLRLHNLKTRLGPLFGRLQPNRPFEPASLDFRFATKDSWEPAKPAVVALKRLRSADLSWSLRKLLRGRYSQAKEVHILFQNAGMEELLCLEMLRGFFGARAHTATLHLIFRHAPERTCSRVATPTHFAHMLQKLSALSCLRMYTDTEALSASFQRLLPMPGQFQTLPVPSLLQKPPPGPSGGGRKTFRLGMLGPPRMEKGFGCLPALLRVLPAEAGGRRLELAVQTEEKAAAQEVRETTATLQAYAQTAAPDAFGLRLLPGPLDSEAYTSCFAGLDCALVLHASPKYAASSSGIFVEALHLGIPSIVFAGTWMGNLILKAAHEGLSIGLCVETLSEVPAALGHIAEKQAAFSDAISKYLVYNAWRFDPKLLAETLFGRPDGMARDKSGAATC